MMVALKALTAWLAATQLYTLPLIGGVLTSLEIAEIANVVIFAILGFGLGALTLYLPKLWMLGPKILLLVLALPFILGTGYIVRHRLWVREVALQAGVNPIQAVEVTDSFLQRETGSSGRLGFYRYTAQVSEPPIHLENLQTLSTSEVEALTNQLSQYSGLQVNLFAMLFNRAGWGIRLIYLMISGFMGLIYFYKGKIWADQQRR